MCDTILRVRYANNDQQDIQVADEDQVANRIDDFKARDTVSRIEVFKKVRDLKRTIVWEGE